MKKILITEGTGFIGSALTRELLEKSYQVIVYDNFSWGKRENLPVQNDSLVIVNGDTLDTSKLNRVMKQYKPEAVFHLAAIHFIPYCNDHPLETLRNNVEGTESVLLACRKGAL